jgi:ribosome-interacting GTPase 1
MPINASPHFERAQAEYEAAQTTEQKIRCLKKMITLAPKHKGSENLLKQLRTRLKKLKYTKEKESKKAGSTQRGIKKEEMQAVIVGKTNTGKSSLISILANVKPEIAGYDFTTKKPLIGMTKHQETNIQLIEIPAVESEYYDRGLVNTADVILVLVKNLTEIKELEDTLKKSPGKKIFVFNKMEKLDERKLEATLKSKRYDYVIINTKTKEGINQLKEKLFQSFGKIRVYTKEPGKEKSKKPLILNPNATIENVALKILKKTSNLKETKIWGPSSKFPGQKVGLKHELKDLDVIEFKTR